jgi:hypothetical protein
MFAGFGGLAGDACLAGCGAAGRLALGGGVGMELDGSAWFVFCDVFTTVTSLGMDFASIKGWSG